MTRAYRILGPVLALALLLGSYPGLDGARAQGCPDHLGVFFDQAGLSHTSNAPSGIVTGYVVVTDLSDPTGLSGFETKIDITGPIIMLGYTLPPSALNVFTPPQFQVGLPYPLPYADAITLITFTGLVTGPEPITFSLSATTPTSFPADPGPGYASGGDPGTLVRFQRHVYSPADVDAVINARSPIDLCPMELGVVISGLGDAENLAGTAAPATDGYDAGVDVAEFAAGSPIRFPHPEWSAPVGADFAQDIKGAFDPLFESRQWTFVVEAQNAQSDPVTVGIDFDPTFGAGDGINLTLHDRTSGATTSLFPNLRYEWSIPEGIEQRTFDLVIGNEAPAGLTVRIDSRAGSVADNDNLAQTAAGATAGYDAGVDLPEPPSPPSDYVATWFPHADWPLGERYRTDARPVFDPMTEGQTWVFQVESDQSGALTLDFAPSFTQSAGIGLTLHDRATGQTVPLFPSLTYSYELTGTEPRVFDLRVGEPEAAFPALGVIVDVQANGIHDDGNLAATRNEATDGFDPGVDLPDPAPPPSTYVSAYFPHADWPFGTRYQTDVRQLFDPFTDTRTWPLVVDSDQTGTVALQFTPNWNTTDGIGLWLRDLTTGETHDLVPALTYSYSQSGPAVRNLELIIGVVTQPPALEPTSRVVPAGWSMIGFPLVPPDPTLQSVVLGDATGLTYLYRYRGAAGYQVAAGSDSVRAGQGLWLATLQQFNWDMSGERALTGVSVPLSPGWNMLGYPMWFPGGLAGVRVDYNGTRRSFYDAVALGIVSASVYDYDREADDYVAITTLQTWHGYWVASLASGVSLRFEWPNFTTPKSNKYMAIDGDLGRPENWRAHVTLTDDSVKRGSVVFGVSPNATAGFDAGMDAPAPPSTPQGPRARLAFWHPEWQLATGSAFLKDIVDAKPTPRQWNAVITRPTPGPVTLSWDAKEWPQELDFQVYLPDQNRCVVLSMAKQSSVTLDVGRVPLAVQFRTPETLTAVEETPAPSLFRLEASPNPFNPAVEIRFTLPSAGRAELRVYDIRGQMVWKHDAGALPAGEHRATWRGLSLRGNPVASGSYFVQLIFDEHRAGPIRKISLVR